MNELTARLAQIISSKDTSPEYFEWVSYLTNQCIAPFGMSDSLCIEHGSLEADLSLSIENIFLYFPPYEIIQSLLFPIWLCRWVASPTHFTKRSDWQLYQLIYTHSGSGIMNLDNNIYHLTPNTLFLLDCRKYHYFYCNNEEGWEYSTVHFEGPCASYLFSQVEKNGLFFTRISDTEIHRLYQKLFSLSEKKPENYYLLFHQTLTNLLVLLSAYQPERAYGQIPPWLSELQVYITDHYNQNWSLQDLAKLANLSVSHMSHAFARYIGCSPIEYRDRLRIEHAKEYLVRTDLSVDQIRELIGYSTVSAFYAKFEKEIGMSPGKYRKQQRMTAWD